MARSKPGSTEFTDEELIMLVPEMPMVTDLEVMHRKLWIEIAECNPRKQFRATDVDRHYGFERRKLRGRRPTSVFTTVLRRMAKDKRAIDVRDPGSHYKGFTFKLRDPDIYERKRLRQYGDDAPHYPVLF